MKQEPFGRPRCVPLTDRFMVLARHAQFDNDEFRCEFLSRVYQRSVRDRATSGAPIRNGEVGEELISNARFDNLREEMTLQAIQPSPI